ncbi:NADPH:quinone reductase [Mycobacterium hodleri]|uniref:NADPH:quinone reductase n=1 Tax=Mycolicibacterium hodleri TaxID=49897 RepID=UPI0021F30EAA|nr:NADPH:quinone reductase [Mycolicibacterium hodleri]MCV7134927.1 NADPH:quinone reductase [Mycolicibacterium hodleri]
MKAIVYHQPGDPRVLGYLERPMPQAAAGQVRVRIEVSAVNPTDVKARQAAGATLPACGQVPHQDGAGIIDQVGEGVSAQRLGERVWIWDAAWRRSEGTAQQFLTMPSDQAATLPTSVSFDVGASLGIPALTAHRALTAHPAAEGPLRPGALSGMTVLVAGGAGVVGHAAIQLARWAGAEVHATVSGPEKSALALAAGACETIDYRRQDVAAVLREHQPRGADVVVEVDPTHNLVADTALLAERGVIAVYGADPGRPVTVPAHTLLLNDSRVQFVFTYLTPRPVKLASVRAVSAAASDGALEVGQEHGLPMHRYRLADTAAAHTRMEEGVVGRVLIDVAHADGRGETS